jgi:riboflavin synthase
MFTGLVQALGQIAAIEPKGAGVSLRIDCPDLSPAEWRTGDSIAVSGCCLTALNIDAQGFSADLSAETLARTSLGQRQPGDVVNLEPSLAVGDRIGGHWVTGHVDGLAQVIEMTADAEGADANYRLVFEVAEPLSRFIAEKGSVTLDGVSLTVNRVQGCQAEVNLIPHTWQVTSLGGLKAGDLVNLEVDLLARYMDRLLTASQAQSGNQKS